MVLILDQSWLWFVSEVRKLIPEQRYRSTSLENIKQWEIVHLTLYKFMPHVTHVHYYYKLVQHSLNSQSLLTT